MRTIFAIHLACSLLLANLAYAEAHNQKAATITGITHGEADLNSPTVVPDGEIWRYGMGVPFQVGPTTAGLFCNIGNNASHDFEMGSDVILFDRLSEIDASRAIPISRVHEEFNPRNGMQYIIAKYTMRGGFVPLGAKRPDGSDHPYAGTGFGTCCTAGFRKDLSLKTWKDKDTYFGMHFYQFSYDGEKFRVTHMDKRPGFFLPRSWRIKNPGMTNAIADGDDFLFAMAGYQGRSSSTSGVVRFQCQNGKWCPVSFTPIAENHSEPSLMRDRGGSLLFSARDKKNAISVWKSFGDSNPDGKTLTWKRVIHAQNIRANTPVVLGHAANGEPYIIANTPEHYRAVLQIWPLNPQRNGLLDPIVVRDPNKEFGPTKGGGRWFVDIPSSGVVRLADEKWHGLLSHRMCAEKEVIGGGSLTEQTGCYIEEVSGNGENQAEWNF